MDPVQGRSTIIDPGSYTGTWGTNGRQLKPVAPDRTNPSGMTGTTFPGTQRGAVVNSSYDITLNGDRDNGTLEIISARNLTRGQDVEKFEVSARDLQNQLTAAGLPFDGKVTFVLDDVPETTVTVDLGKMPNGDAFIKGATVGNGGYECTLTSAGDGSPVRLEEGFRRPTIGAMVIAENSGSEARTGGSGEAIDPFVALDPNYAKAFPPPLGDAKALEKWRVNAELFQYGQKLEANNVKGTEFDNMMIARATELREDQFPKNKGEDSDKHYARRDKWIADLNAVGTYHAARATVAAMPPVAAPAAPPAPPVAAPPAPTPPAVPPATPQQTQGACEVLTAVFNPGKDIIQVGAQGNVAGNALDVTLKRDEGGTLRPAEDKPAQTPAATPAAIDPNLLAQLHAIGPVNVITPG